MGSITSVTLGNLSGNTARKNCSKNALVIRRQSVGIENLKCGGLVHTLLDPSHVFTRRGGATPE